MNLDLAIRNFIGRLCYKEKILLEVKHIGKFLFDRNVDDNNIKRESEYFCQAQFMMFVCNLKKTVFIIKNTNNKFIYSFLVEYDYLYIQSTLPLIQKFYQQQRLPYLLYNKYKTQKGRNIAKSKNNPKSKTKIRKLKKKKSYTYYINMTKLDNDIYTKELLPRYEAFFPKMNEYDFKVDSFNFVNENHELLENEANFLLNQNTSTLNNSNQRYVGSLLDILNFDYRQVGIKDILDLLKLKKTGRKISKRH